MYESFFGLSEKPFSLNPDPGFLYLGRDHSRALSMLEFGLASETGVVVITGEIGSGKTTLVRALLNQLDDGYTVGLITNTHKAFGELIHWVSMAFGLEHEGRDKVGLYNQFVEFMISEYAAGRRVVIIVDEAQNMSADTLEELRVISNINADKDIVMQLVLVGQPELRETLAQPRMKQFVQRISSYFYLKPLNLHETREYIEHRLKTAGARGRIFDYEAVYLIHQNSEGVPRVVNTLCHLACTYAYAEQTKKVTGDIVREVITDRNEHELFGKGTLTVPDEHRRRSEDEAQYEPVSFLSHLEAEEAAAATEAEDAEGAPDTTAGTTSAAGTADGATATDASASPTDTPAAPANAAPTTPAETRYTAPTTDPGKPTSLFDRIHAHTKRKLAEAERAKQAAAGTDSVLDITGGHEISAGGDDSQKEGGTGEPEGSGMRKRLSRLFSGTE